MSTDSMKTTAGDEGEREQFWRERYREANDFAHRIEVQNLDLQWEIKDLNRRLRIARRLWRQMNPEVDNE